MINPILLIFVGILLQAIALGFQILLIKTPKQEWDYLHKNQGHDLDKSSQKQFLKLAPFYILFVSIIIQSLGVYLDLSDDFNSMIDIHMQIQNITSRLDVIEQHLP